MDAIKQGLEGLVVKDMKVHTYNLQDILCFSLFSICTRTCTKMI